MRHGRIIRVDQITTTLNFDHKFNDRWKLNVVSSYQQYKRDYFGTERIQFDANGGWKRQLTRSGSNEDYYATQANIIGNFKVAGVANKLLVGS